MDVNDDGGRLDVRGALTSFASKLAPTFLHRVSLGERACSGQVILQDCHRGIRRVRPAKPSKQPFNGRIS
ncbi:hypothetical protein ELQ88_23290 [Pseudomonas sp. MPC6]|nr:hypothetical protein ELQ88_23290 [Pseudomonas sp. MPC6]